jgi:DUF4097 and DUF4098 domain-containing protein YvlB
MNALHHTITWVFTGMSALLFVATCQAGSTVEQNRPVAADGLVQVENLAGSIEFTAWDKAEVGISGELGDDVEELEILESSSGIQIRVRNRRNQRNVEDTHLRLQVPVAASVEAESVSAEISLNGLRGGSIVFNSVSGDLLADAEAPRLELESVSGDVTFRGATSRAEVETVSGEIDLQGIEGEIMISTVSGDVKLSGNRVDRGRFETVSGDLDLQLDVPDGGRVNAQSMSGDVSLTLPTGQQAEYTAQTYSGEIRSDFGTVTAESGGAGSSLSWRESSNGATIEIESFSGDIHIKGQ